MPRLPWEKFWYSAWMADPGLRACGPAARGCWIDTLCDMWHDSIHFKTRTLAGWSRYWGCSTAEAQAAIEELRGNKVALVRSCPAHVTLTSRRLKRRYQDKIRQRQRRASGSGRVERREERGEKERDGAGAPGLLSPHALLAGGMRAADLAEFIPRAGRMLNKDNGDPRTVLAAVLQAHAVAAGTGMMGYAYQVLKGDGPGDGYLAEAKRYIAEGCK